MQTHSYIPRSGQGRRLVVPDIHGCFLTFRTLLWDKLQFDTKDQLFLLGDYIDRGPDSKAVLDLIIAMRKAGYQVFPLRGNHEDDLLDSAAKYNHRLLARVLKFNKSLSLLSPQGGLYPEHVLFLQSLPYYYELDDFFLVHAGFSHTDDPLADARAMLWMRGFTEVPAVIGHKKVVHGHVPTPFSLIQENLRLDKQIIPLDNGCVFPSYRKFDPGETGRLCCLDLDSLELHVQSCLDEIP